MVGVSEKIYTLGIIGYGGMASNHRKQLEKGNVRVRLKGVYDIDESRREAAVNDGYVAYDSCEALLSDKEIDIILVATPNNSHKELCLKALAAGKHQIRLVLADGVQDQIWLFGNVPQRIKIPEDQIDTDPSAL